MKILLPSLQLAMQLLWDESPHRYPIPGLDSRHGRTQSQISAALSAQNKIKCKVKMFLDLEFRGQILAGFAGVHVREEEDPSPMHSHIGMRPSLTCSSEEFSEDSSATAELTR